MHAEGPTTFTATASAHVAQPPERVWAELLHPGARWMLGANIESDLQPGSPITFEGHFFGRQFADTGEVIAVERARLLHFTHFSPLGDLDDVPENYHEIRITLTPDAGGTAIEVRQENIRTQERADRAAQNWRGALATLAHSDTEPSSASSPTVVASVEAPPSGS
ncbi:uncharacterized protein YndB with AHSA1/START domain [Isoptericola jiangsuensis]|uniref:Uncharacterized protein YndB with AHSA1/START domain n=1 Tax=Isoptericola jiangsuensis TaxID=548579 RepID=A0A2A9F2S4_9MICO|nr:SRPBCC family protein [Isoptericola jiangsuensis]PFG44810.1 uncharacterized protein YndB with AHSA1/START domain [Isoptericola jiangsuensis]